MLDSLKKKLSFQDWRHAQDDQGKKTTISLEKLSEGDCLKFGVLPQDQLSNTRCIIGAPTLYNFASTQLTSFPLFDEEFNQLCHMIVASVKNKSPYLAISKKLSHTRLEEVFTDDDYKRLQRMDHPHHLYARKHTANLQEWLHLHYEKKIHNAKGTKILPDQDVKSFSYSLYVAEEQFKALEIERYANGEFDVYATIFRPVTDIAEIKHHRKTSTPYKKAMPVTPPPIAPIVEPAETKIPQDETKDSAEIFSLPTALNIEGSAFTTATHNLPARTQEHDHIKCNLRMASKLIDEAVSSDMRVSDVIRKALGLSIADVDTVKFDIQLTERDYKILASRFDLDPNNKDMIHSLIMEELGHFTGEPLDE